jgi:hypothetical protein
MERILRDWHTFEWFRQFQEMYRISRSEQNLQSWTRFFNNSDSFKRSR